ncbi:hypothetical protein Q5P01_016717 [Channa striata]|uniref:Uncharacterized protein n=1 Tax=Channa striata TaxID=64152 RepID=A0AA88M8B2_CHASR|nr:hypothetical protein Q5P01_016717 [Channa striata]
MDSTLTNIFCLIIVTVKYNFDDEEREEEEEEERNYVNAEYVHVKNKQMKEQDSGDSHDYEEVENEDNHTEGGQDKRREER